MTADEFFWWWVERQSGFTEEALRNDPTMQQIVKEEADRRNLELIDRVMAEFLESALAQSLDVSCTRQARPLAFFTSLNGPPP